MTTQTPTTEERLSRLEGAYEQISERLGDLRADMNVRMNELAHGQEDLRSEVREEMRSLRSEMNSRFNTLLVLLGGVWATTVGGFIALFTRL